jgi:beta-N-acetylhexosaminidase
MDTLTADMTLERLIGQCITVGFRGHTPTSELLDLIQRDHIGGVILFARNIRDREQTAALTHALQSAARAAGHPAPLLVMTDQENGSVRRLGAGSTLFPGALALGAIHVADAAEGERIVEGIARATAQELLAHGVNMNLAPVMDVYSNTANPVTGARSFGEDTGRVAILGAATVRGLQGASVIATLKHFPGHGDTTVDSHLALPVVTAPLGWLEAVELEPFRRGVAAGAACLMTAHVAYPALTGSATQPATLAPEIMTGQLRERLGFDGVVISDCLEMKAIANTVGVEQGAVKALAAGVDLVLISHTLDHQRASIAAIRTTIADGELSLERVREAAGRVLRLKRRFLSWRDDPAGPLDAQILREHQELSAQAYTRSITLIRDEGRLLPLHLRPDQELLALAPPSRAANAIVDTSASRGSLLGALQRYHRRTRLLTPDTVPMALTGVQRADLKLLVTRDLHRDPEQLEIARRLAQAGPTVIGLAVGAPYDAAALPEVSTYLAVYEDSPPALDVAVDALFGRLEPRGRLPVTITAP